MGVSKHRLLPFPNPGPAFEELPRTRGIDIVSEAVSLADKGERS